MSDPNPADARIVDVIAAVDQSFLLPKPGDVVDEKYELLRVLGQGGMGIVYAAHHRLLDQTVAIKFLSGETADAPDAVERFKREARASAKVVSDHVAHVYDVGVLPQGCRYMVMEYLRGGTLADRLEESTLLPSEACEIAVQVLDALERAHEAGIVHRDIKPENVFLNEQSDGIKRVKVLDFGISKVETEGTLQLTGSSDVMGTPYYMSPEQMAHPDRVDYRSDLWSVGVLLYEMLSGELPYESESLHELCMKVLSGDPPHLSETASHLPWPLEDVVMRCLERAPEHRPPSARSISEELMAFIDQPTMSLPAIRSRVSSGFQRMPSGLSDGSLTPAVPNSPSASHPSASSATLASHSLTSPPAVRNSSGNWAHAFGLLILVFGAMALAIWLRAEVAHVEALSFDSLPAQAALVGERASHLARSEELFAEPPFALQGGHLGAVKGSDIVGSQGKKANEGGVTRTVDAEPQASGSSAPPPARNGSRGVRAQRSETRRSAAQRPDDEYSDFGGRR